ncbi:MAG: autotransporter outer membrane beta-barrel domain-containing protein, partial [Methylomonas sp.]
YAFSWGGGYDFNYQALTIAPYARGDYSNLDIGSYTETGSIAAIHFGKQNIESLTSTLGVQTAYTFSFPWGVLIPQLRGEWHHQFSDGARQIQASFASDPAGEIFTLNGTGPSRDYYTVGAEVSSVLPGGVSAFLAYETLQGYTNINSNKLMLGARMEF